MRKLALAVLFSAVSSVGAMAGDLASGVSHDGAPIGFNWTGAYVGGLIGYGTGDTEAIGNPGFDGSAPDDRAVFDPDGFIGGVLVGYNWQVDNFVFGLEGEAGYLGVKENLWYPDGDDYFAGTEYGLYGSVVGRVGVAFDRTLLGVKAGVMVSRIDYGFGDIDGGIDGEPDDSASVFGDTSRVGYTVGASLEHAFIDQWIGRLDYTYADFGSFTRTDRDGEDYRISNDLHMIRIGVSYKF